MWRRAALVRSDISEERVASIIRVKRICKLGTALASLLVTANAVHCSLILFQSDERGYAFLWNVSCHKSHTASHSRRRYTSYCSISSAWDLPVSTCDPLTEWNIRQFSVLGEDVDRRVVSAYIVSNISHRPILAVPGKENVERQSEQWEQLVLSSFFLIPHLVPSSFSATASVVYYC
jgi:hypothetical protein